MNWMMIFLIICMYPILVVMYFTMKTEVKPKGLLRFGVTVPGCYLEDERLLAITESYRRRLNLHMVILAVIPVLIIFVPYVSIGYTVWTVWLFALLILMVLPYVRANKETMRLKEEQQWQRAFGEMGADAEDRFWKWGMIYSNPTDKRGIVNARMGVGTAVNMAKKWAKILTGVAVIIFLGLLLFCVWFVAEEFTPISLTYENGVVIAGHLRENYRIKEEDIEEVQLLTEMPKMSKKSGTGLDNLRKGTYHIRNAGDYEVLQNPQNKYVIYIRSIDGECYYLSDAKDEQTKRVYEALEERK